MAYGFNQTGTLKVDKETASRERLASLKERGLTERAGIAARAIKKPAMKPVGDTIAEAPYLPKEREAGRLGDIMRASPKELQSIYEGLPEAERPVHLIRGTEESYFSPGTRQEYGDLRTAMTGFRQRPAETTAAGRLSAAIQERDREQMLEDYDIKTTAMFSPHITRGEGGEEMVSPQLRELYSTGKAMSIEDPAKALKFVKEGVAKFKEDRAETERLSLMSAEELEAERLRLIGGETKGMGASVAPTERLAPEKEPASPAERRKSAAERLRETYEEEEAAPIIGAKTLGRISEAWKRRGESSYVEAPTGLRGYR